VCCSVLQCAPASTWPRPSEFCSHESVRCSVLQCVAVCCSVLQCAAAWHSVLQWVAVSCSVSHGRARLQSAATTLCAAAYCSVLLCHANELWIHKKNTLSLFSINMLKEPYIYGNELYMYSKEPSVSLFHKHAQRALCIIQRAQHLRKWAVCLSKRARKETSVLALCSIDICSIDIGPPSVP